MDFEFFENLNADEARKFLLDFQDYGRAHYPEFELLLASEGKKADFTLDSLCPILICVLGKLKTVPLPVDPSVPNWIRETDIYLKSLFDIAEVSKPLVLQCAYYLGETFIRLSSYLKWDIGDADTAVENMPVVSGFHDKELAPLLILENLFCRVIREPACINDIETAIKRWHSYVPE